MSSESSSSGSRRLALLSVSDKSGLVEFARRIAAAGFELISTGGTAQALRQTGLPVRDVSDLTGFPEMLEGRVKTLHPKVHGGLLGRRDKAEHRQQMAEHGIAPIDLVVINLYPFERTAARPGVAFEDLIENIDIGGPSMVRSAAKNFDAVAVVTSPEDYDRVAGEIEVHGAVLPATRWELARKAFARTAAYDATIASTLERVTGEPGHLELPASAEPFPQHLRLQYEKKQDLRYGENPHQKAAVYSDPNFSGGIAHGEVLQGKELSFNNLVDLEACWDLVQEFEHPAVAIIKHTNPCGCAEGATVVEAYQKALAADPVSAFGSVIGINREVDEAAAKELSKLFVECIAAPGYSAAALAVFAAKKNLRLLKVPGDSRNAGPVMKTISGGLLMQDRDLHGIKAEELKVVTERAPSEEELRGLLFGWKVCKHVKSNAIVFARDGQTVSVGAGQMSRIDSVKLAATKAQLPLAGAVLASDAFFPFADNIEEAAKHGITAVIQPGGSVRDEESIAACNRHGIAMVFTGVRHFRH